MVTTLPAHLFSTARIARRRVALKLSFRFLTNWAAFQTALPLILTLLLVDIV